MANIFHHIYLVPNTAAKCRRAGISGSALSAFFRALHFTPMEKINLFTFNSNKNAIPQLPGS